MIKDFLSLLYPAKCAGCKTPLEYGEKSICTTCRIHLPRTHFESYGGNFVERLFWSKAPVKRATAHYFFRKSSFLQRIMHQFKYHGNQQIGITLGQWMGQVLAQNYTFRQTDVIIPIPLHPTKLKSRGFNQAALIGTGVASQLTNAQLLTHAIVRNTATSSQTKKNVWERNENVNSIFTCPEPYLIKNKRILLLDDVITTGSTAISAVNELVKAGSREVNVATLAVAWR